MGVRSDRVNRLAAILLGAVVLVSSAPAPRASHSKQGQSPGEPSRTELVPAQPGSASVWRKLDWSHWGLELYLCGAKEGSGSVRLEFCLELKSGIDRAWTSVGSARYRLGTGRWHEAPTGGLPGSRVLTVSPEHGQSGSFSVLVAKNVSALRLSVGDHPIDVDLAQPYRADRDSTRSSSEGKMAVAPVEAPDVPTRLEASLRWDGDKPFVDGALDAGESGELLIDVINRGEREARGVEIVVSAGELADLLLPAPVTVPTIAPRGRTTVPLTIRSGPDLPDATHRLVIEVREPFGHDAQPLAFELNARGAPWPELVLTDDFAVEGPGLPVPRDTIVTLRLRVRNVGRGPARDVVAEIRSEPGVYPAHDSPRRFEAGDLDPGEVAELSYRCYANQHAEALRLDVELSHRRTGSAAARSLVSLPLVNSPSVARIVRVEPDPPAAVSLAPAPAPLTSDIDRDVPRSAIARPRGLAVVLGVESYAAAPSAAFSTEDARTAARYFEHTLGIPPQRIQLLLDQEVTLGQFQRLFGRDGWLARRTREDTDVFIFFAGHGVAGMDAFEPFLVPADADLNYVEQTGFPLDRMIERLNNLTARSVTVFLDACFSGMTRQGQTLLAGARPLAVVPTSPRVSGLSLFSAARGTQVAHALDDQGHGLFSYHVFRGLGGKADLDRDGSITTQELKLYIEQAIPDEAARLDKEQTPSIVLDNEDRILTRLPDPE